MKRSFFLTFMETCLLLGAAACKNRHNNDATVAGSVSDPLSDSLAMAIREDSLRMEGIRTYDLTLLELHGKVKKVEEHILSRDLTKTYEFSPEGVLLTVNGMDPFRKHSDNEKNFVEFSRDKEGRIVSIRTQSFCQEVVWDSASVYSFVEHYDEDCTMECRLNCHDNGIVYSSVTMEREGNEAWERTGRDELEYRLDAYGNWIGRIDSYGTMTLRKIVYYD